MDIRCVKCGESWGVYGVNHGDMLPWEAKLFKAGAGCPSCEGEANGWTPETLSDVENGDEDPMLRIIAAERVTDGTAPEWKRPENPVHWQCDGCGVQVITDVDTNELEYHVPYKSKARGWYSSHPFHRGTPEKEPAHTWPKGIGLYSDPVRVCEFCLEHCAECGEPISSLAESESVYEAPGSNTEHVCSLECLSAAEEKEAAEVWAHCYREKDRIAYIRDNLDQFEFSSFADLMACVRGKYFAGYASELLS